MRRRGKTWRRNKEGEDKEEKMVISNYSESLAVQIKVSKTVMRVRNLVETKNS